MDNYLLFNDPAYFDFDAARRKVAMIFLALVGEVIVCNTSLYRLIATSVPRNLEK